MRAHTGGIAKEKKFQCFRIKVGFVPFAKYVLPFSLSFLPVEFPLRRYVNDYPRPAVFHPELRGRGGKKERKKPLPPTEAG